MTKLTNAVELIEQLRQHDAGISRSGVSVTIFSEAADRIAALEAEVKRTRCPIKMDDARNLCSAGCCYACVCDRLRAATERAQAAERTVARYRAGIISAYAADTDYKLSARTEIARVCDEIIDRSGRLLGEVRDAALAAPQGEP